MDSDEIYACYRSGEFSITEKKSHGDIEMKDEIEEQIPAQNERPDITLAPEPFESKKEEQAVVSAVDLNE